MSEIITVQGYRLKVETGDEIYVEKHMCGRCDSEHTKISVSRNGKEIASLGVGVLGDIVPFLKWWAKDRGIGDLEYCSARLLQYLCNKYDKLMDTIEAQRNTDVVVTEKPKFTGTLGHGICTGFHGDIEYFYAIRSSKVEVYEVPCDENCDTWKLIKSIKLAKNGA